MARSVERMLSPSREQERDLVLAFQAGDAAAYESIDRSCRPAAERICRRLLINPADVEEAVQETMVRAYQGLPRFNGSYALKAWVARIATNVCLDTLRARSRRPVNGGTLEPGTDAPNGHDGNGRRDDPEELLEQAADAEEVRRVLAALPERHRTALVLREFEGLSHRKIADMLDTSPERVKALIHRAKAGFRRAWKDDNGGRLAAFTPLLTPVNWVRRLFGRAPEFDYSATTSAANAASSPAAQTLVSVAGERVSTALAAVMLAGTVGFAVQNAPRPSRAQEEPAIVQIVTAPAPLQDQDAKQARDDDEKNERDRAKPEPEASPSPEVAPPVETELEEVVLDDPEDADSPEPEADASPEPPTHPEGFSYSFTSDRTAVEYCGCGSAPVVTQSGLAVSEQGFSSYSGGISAAAISDSTGQAAWPADLQISASDAQVEVRFQIRTPDGPAMYEAQGVRGAVTQEPWGGWTYSYSGSYERRSGPPGQDYAPFRGRFTAALTFSWVEQRMVWASFSLDES